MNKRFIICLLFVSITALYAQKSFEPVFSITENTVTFRFYSGLFKSSDIIESVEVCGTFNNWKGGSDWRMEKRGLNWTLLKPFPVIAVPGNSGLPEFQFLVNGKNWIKPGSDYPAGYQFQGHFVILSGTVTPGEIEARDRKSREILNDAQDENRLANFREVRAGVIGPKKLYRSYHPFIPSKKSQPLEKKRLETVVKLMEKSGICSVVNLSDQPSVLRLKAAPVYYKAIGEDGNVLFAETDYHEAYYRSDSPEFARTLREILEFIAKTKTPVLIHCRLGTDRTGVVIAVLEAFMGASWEEIRIDFEKTNENLLGEYRDADLLAYSLSKMIKKDIKTTPDLRIEFIRFLTENTGVTPAVLDTVYRQLK